MPGAAPLESPPPLLGIAASVAGYTAGSLVIVVEMSGQAVHLIQVMVMRGCLPASTLLAQPSASLIIGAAAQGAVLLTYGYRR